MPHASDDRAVLARAIALAEPARGRARPNPAVGCVLVRDGVVVGQGATQPPPGPHAEVVALAAAGSRARGATAAVTLEPCAHQGRTPPCTDALLAAGVTRVVVAVADPHPHAGGGRAHLAAAGVEVVGPLDGGDLLAGAVRRQLEGFLTRTVHARPHVTLKLAQTVDGALTAPDGRRWITGPAARRGVHRWRAAVDAVLVGVGTVLADDPRLDVRGRSHPVHQPRPVVLDTQLRTSPGAQVLARGALVVAGEAASERRARALTAAGAEVVRVAAGSHGGLDLSAALSAVAADGRRSVLAEPGPTLARALIAADLVDRVVLHVAVGLGSGPPRRALELPAGWVAERTGGAGGDLVLQLVRPGCGTTPPPGPSLPPPTTPTCEEAA